MEAKEPTSDDPRISEILKEIESTLATNRQAKSPTTQDSFKKYKCQKCHDTGFIVKDNVAHFCECREKRQYERRLEESGILAEYQKSGFKNYITEGLNPQIATAKKMAIDYANKFPLIKDQRENSIAFLASMTGEKKVGIGCGKTHLCIAIANNLMRNDVGVLYMPYREDIPKLKQNMIDEEYYQKEMNRYKHASVLLIDDLFKGKVNATDANIMFEIINYRYLAKKPIIVSSELSQSDLINFDEAIGSRIIQMCKNHLLEFKLSEEELNSGKTLDYRLKKE